MATVDVPLMTIEHKTCQRELGTGSPDRRYWAASMTSRGAILDVHTGMKQVACMLEGPFPAAKARNAPDARGDFLPAAEKFPRHVLVVDDEPLIRWSVAESLAELGYDVEEAADAHSALRKVTTTALGFDVVVLDLRLPDMADLSLLATLRQLVPGASLVLMTAFGTPEIIAHARELGAEVLLKPFELDELKRLVRGSA